ncbi:hypothetical protein OH76DRAFT_152703 [Lentinus brumalis]|uniref:Uncharacterized protein n=1 Tax=Lentinus brumalis TaxID=2498619 RepID=A0A371CNX3_9APHY|nr:hypothetical protein OH76DRAFT_152703 [Polyporus brumalis]
MCASAFEFGLLHSHQPQWIRRTLSGKAYRGGGRASSPRMEELEGVAYTRCACMHGFGLQSSDAGGDESAAEDEASSGHLHRTLVSWDVDSQSQTTALCGDQGCRPVGLCRPSREMCSRILRPNTAIGPTEHSWMLVPEDGTSRLPLSRCGRTRRRDSHARDVGSRSGSAGECSTLCTCRLADIAHVCGACSVVPTHASGSFHFPFSKQKPRADGCTAS